MKERVGALRVIERLPGSMVRCVCDCGGERVLRVGHWNAEYFSSCGCLTVRHGHGGVNRSKEYISYHNMIARCCKPWNKRYKDYGAIGIGVCERWMKFQNFIDDMGPCPNEMQLERVDNTKGYSPENCIWATRKQNMRNRRNSKVWMVNGVEYETASEAAEVNGVSSHTIIAWCQGRTAAGRHYPPKNNCGVRPKYELSRLGYKMKK